MEDWSLGLGCVSRCSSHYHNSVLSAGPSERVVLWKRLFITVTLQWFTGLPSERVVLWKRLFITVTFWNTDIDFGIVGDMN